MTDRPDAGSPPSLDDTAVVPGRSGQPGEPPPARTGPTAPSPDTTRTTPSVPWWVCVLDLATVALVGAAVYVYFFGGIHARVLGIPLLIKSPVRALRRAVVIAFLRHVVHRRPSLPTRVVTGIRQIRPTWQRWDRRWPLAFTIVPVALVSRVLVLVVGFVAVLAVGYAPGAPPFRVSPSELVNLPVRWDGGWYLGLIVDGYAWPSRARGQANVAFFPAYPWLVRTVGLFQLDRDSAAVAAWLAVAVSILLFAFALCYVYRLALRVGTPDTATAAIGLLATFPFALFFSVPYTESLFLLVTSAAIYHQGSAQYWRAAAFAFVAGLSRPNGVLVGLPLVLLAMRHAWTARRGTPPSDVRAPGPAAWARRTWVGWLAAAAPSLGVLVYSTICWWNTGHPFLWLDVQSVGWKRSSTPFWPVLDEVRRMMVPRLETTWEWTPYDVFNLLATTLAVLAIWPISRRLGPELGAYVAVSVLVPVTYGGLMSLGRFTSVLFPIFIWLGLALGRRGREATTMVFAAGQALFAVLFFTWRPMF